MAFASGDVIPVTPEWLDRKQFAMTEKQMLHVESWVAERVTEALRTPYRVDTSDPV